MIGWNWKEPRKTTIFDIIDCLHDKISFIVSEVKFRFKPRPKRIVTLTNEKIYCPIDETHILRHESCKTSYGTITFSFYCIQCVKHYLRNEMIIK